MKGLLFVIIAMFFLLAGCAAKEDQTAVHHEEMEKAQEVDQTKTATEVPEAKAMAHEQGMMHAPEPKDLDYATSKLSANGVYSISYMSIGGNIRVNRVHSWELSIKDADGQPVNDARVLVSGDMPEQGIGLPAEPVVTRAGFEGLYRVDNMKFSMPGWWVVTIDVMAEHGEPDSAAFNLDIP